MSDRRLLSRSRGVEVNFIPQPDGTFLIEHREDVEPHLEYSKNKMSTDDVHVRRKQDQWHVAHIPILVQYQWLREYGVDIFNPDHEPAVKRLLNSNEWRYLKTAEVIL